MNYLRALLIFAAVLAMVYVATAYPEPHRSYSSYGYGRPSYGHSNYGSYYRPSYTSYHRPSYYRPSYSGYGHRW